MGFAKQWKGVNSYVIREPGLFFDEYDESHGIGYPLAFMLVSFVVAALPVGILSAALNITTPGEAALGLVLFVLFGVLFWFMAVIEALIAHGIASLLGARGAAKTFEAYAFPTIVRYGLWWIPLVNIGLGLYGFFLQITAISMFHDISTGKAAAAAILGLLLYFPVVIILVAVIGAFVLDLGSTAGGAPPA